MTRTVRDPDRHDDDAPVSPRRARLAARVGLSVLLVGGLTMLLAWLIVTQGEGFDDARTALMWVWGFALVLLVVFFGHALVETWRSG